MLRVAFPPPAHLRAAVTSLLGWVETDYGPAAGHAHLCPLGTLSSSCRAVERERERERCMFTLLLSILPSLATEASREERLGCKMPTNPQPAHCHDFLVNAREVGLLK